MAKETNSRRQFIRNTTGVVLGAGVTLSAASWNRVLGANDRVRLGVIGTGNRGSDVMGFFLKESDVDVVAVCDVYEKAMLAAKAKTEDKAQTFSDHRALLASKDVDAVLIATPDHWHAQISIDACNAGKDVYCEKPLTWSYEEGHEIISAVKSNKRVFQVGLQQRSGTHYAEAKRALDQLHRELMDLNPSAARSLEEGMEETLTVHKLRVPEQLRRTLCCTNVIESAFSIVETVCRNVKRWRDGDHIERWVGSGLLAAERQFRKVIGFRQIPLLMSSMANLVSKKPIAKQVAVA